MKTAAKMGTLVRTVVALAILGAVAVSACWAAGARNLDSTQAKALLAKEKKLVLLDVRTPEEYRQARLHGAKLIPLGELERRIKEVPRDKPLLVYCAVGARSATAANMLASKGYPEVYQMSDGLVGWYKKGYPIER